MAKSRREILKKELGNFEDENKEVSNMAK